MTVFKLFCMIVSNNNCSYYIHHSTQNCILSMLISAMAETLMFSKSFILHLIDEIYYYSVTLVGGVIGRSQKRRFEKDLNFVDLIKHLKQKFSNKEIKTKVFVLKQDVRSQIVLLEMFSD